MKSQPSLGVSILLWVLIGLGYLAYRHWPAGSPSRAHGQEAPVMTSHFAYLPDLSAQVTALAEKQPAFTALLARMRVNLADVTLKMEGKPDNYAQNFYVELKNRTDSELSWLDAHPDAPADAFVDSDNPNEGLYRDTYGCLTYRNQQYWSAECPQFPADFSPRDYMLAAYYYGLDDDISIVRLCLGADTEITSHAKYDECLKSQPKGWRVTIEDGKFRVYGDPTEAQDHYAAGILVYEELRYAVIDMSVSWHLAFSPYFFRMLQCAFAPSCATNMMFGFGRKHAFNLLRDIDLGIPDSDIDPDKLSMRYVEATPEFENWGGDQLERRLAADFTFPGDSLGDKPEDAGEEGSVGPEFEDFIRNNRDYLYSHPRWFLDHPLWTLRLRGAMYALGYRIPDRPLTRADIARLLSDLNAVPLTTTR